jgi:putative transposase
VVSPAARRGVVEHLRESWKLSERRACRLAGLARAVWRYRLQPDRDPAVRARLLELAARYPRYGYELLYLKLRREGFAVNHKRVLRLYREERLVLRPRSKRKRVAAAPRPARVFPQAPNERWSMDFMSDTLESGRVFRALNVLDDFSRECLAIEVDLSLPGERVVRVLDRLAFERGLPRAITLDNGPEFVSKALDHWAYRTGVELLFIRPGKPVENAFVESFNGTLRNDCFNQHWFNSLGEARVIVEGWRREYNQERPHSALGGMTPREFAALRSLPPPHPPAPSGLQTPGSLEEAVA